MIYWARCEQPSNIHGPLTIYIILRSAHAPRMLGTFSLAPTSKETASQQSRHASRQVRHERAVMRVGISNSRWRRKRPRHSRRIRNPQFCVSGNRPMQCRLLRSLYWHLFAGMLPHVGTMSSCSWAPCRFHVPAVSGWHGRKLLPLAVTIQQCIVCKSRPYGHHGSW